MAIALNESLYENEPRQSLPDAFSHDSFKYSFYYGMINGMPNGRRIYAVTSMSRAISENPTRDVSSNMRGNFDYPTSILSWHTGAGAVYAAASVASRYDSHIPIELLCIA